MCSPIALLAASTVASVAHNRAQTNAQVAQYNAQAEAAEMNKRISDRKQEQIAEMYLQDRQKMNDKMRLVAGRNAAEFGATGITMAGSALDLMGSSYDEFHKDIYNWETNKNNDIYNESLNGLNYINQANADRSAAANARAQGNMALVGTILGAASSYYGMKSQYAQGSAQQTSSVMTVPDSVGYSRDFTTGKWSSNMFNSVEYAMSPYSFYKNPYSVTFRNHKIRL